MNKKNIIIIIGVIILIIAIAFIALQSTDVISNKSNDFKFPNNFNSKVMKENKTNNTYIVARNPDNDMIIYIHDLNISKFNKESKLVYKDGKSNLYYYTAGNYSGFIEIVAFNNHQYEIKTKTNGTGMPSKESLNTLTEFNKLNNLSATTV